MTLDLAALDAALADAHNPPRGGGDWFAHLDAETQAIVQKHMDRPRSQLSDQTIAETLTKALGAAISAGMVQSHRSGQCSCPPKT